MDINIFLQKYNEHIKYAKRDGGYDIAFPFKFYNDDHISSVHISEDETGLFTITDNGNTMLYLENMCVNIEEHTDKIQKICKLFNLTIENGIVKSILGEYITNQTFTQLTNFLIGISHLATIKYLD